MENKYTIELSEKQMRLMAKSLEMHSRMRCGQLGESYMPPIQDKIWNLEGEDMSQKRKVVENALQDIKDALWPELSRYAHHGVGHDDEADLGYEMYKCILSQFEKDYEEEAKSKGEKYFGNVHTGTPLKLTNHPFIKIEKND